MVDVAELLKLPPPAPNTVRFFKKGGQYYAIEQDAELIASKHLRSIGALRDSGPNHKFVSISEVLFTSLVRDLLILSRTSIDLYEFETNKWNKGIEASPGNISSVADLINQDLDISNSSILLSVSCKLVADQIEFQACSCDPTLFSVATTTFLDTPTFAQFEALLSQIMPAELLFSKIPEIYKSKLEIISEKFRLPFRFTEKNEKAPSLGEFPDNPSVHALLCALHLNVREFKHIPFTLTQFMTVDYSAATALNIFPEPGTICRGPPTSLYVLLNTCSTPMGSRLLHQHLQQPLVNIKQINDRLDKIEGLINDPSGARIIIRDSLKSLPDISRLIKKFMNNKANLQDCVRLHDIAAVGPHMLRQLTDIPSSLEALISQIQNSETECNEIVELIEQTIDFKILPQHIYRICPDFDDNLQEISNKLDEIKNRMEKCRLSIANDLGIDEDKVKLERSTNLKSFYFRAPKNFERTIQNADGTKIIEARKDGVHFSNQKLDNHQKTLLDLELDYSEKQKEISKALISKLSQSSDLFDNLSNTFAELDFYCALAEVAESNNYVRPIISDENDAKIELTAARHPLVEKHCDNFIANDVILERGVSNFAIISGPNSAGKSTMLKTVGTNIFLAHLGSYVPCNSARIPLTSSIHARVGAWDSLNMSTFSVEMTEMASILQSANSKSLILVDELGRSTSCSDGFGLAWAISKYLATKIGGFTLFATHFHELCSLENEIECVANFCMEAALEDGLLMKYQLKPGEFPKSFGIDAAKRAGFPETVMQRAMEKALELEAADGESEISGPIRFDPNEPGEHFIQKLRTIDLEQTNPMDVVKRTQEFYEQLEKEEAENNPTNALKKYH